MAKIQFLSITEQVTQHLREEIHRGRYGEIMPGVRSLTDELGVDMKTINNALRALEREKLLVAQGAGRQRRINKGHSQSRKSLRIQILLYERSDHQVSYHIDIKHRLESDGHVVSFSDKTLDELGMDVAKVARHARSAHADAWVVASGSHDVLKWFTDQSIPVFALFGAITRLPIAGIGPTKYTSQAEAIKCLVDLQHQRIVMISRETKRQPVPLGLGRCFLDTLQSMNIPVGPYNLPVWQETREDFQRMLESLFKVTPPTALIIDGTAFYFAAQNFLAQRGLGIPRDVSLICLDPDPLFIWADPQISHISWDSRPWVKRVVQWARHVAKGKEDLRQDLTPSEFVIGGTVGPAPGSRRSS